MTTKAIRTFATASVALLLVSVTACADDPTSPARAGSVTPAVAAARAAATSDAPGVEHDIAEWTANMTGQEFSLSCDGQPEGEMVRLEGLIHSRFSAFRDAAGGRHIWLRTRSEGLRGVGVESGEEFRYVDRYSESRHRHPDGGAVLEFRLVIELVGRDTRRSLSIVEKGRLVVNANGEWVVDQWSLVEDCNP